MNWKLGLNFYSSNLVIFNPANIGTEHIKQTIQDGHYHIYIIGKRKKLFFDKSKLDGTLYTSNFYYLDSSHNKIYSSVIHSSDLKIHSQKEGAFEITYKGSSAVVTDSLLINEFYHLPQDVVGTSDPNPLPSDLEVMYVGQSFGRNAVRTIDYRLANHDKLQQIVLKILAEGSNEEVLIIGIKVSTNDLATALVEFKNNDARSSVDELRKLQKKASARLAPGQEITVFEASLINYFQPPYNKEYKTTFPSQDFSSYDELFQTEFNYSAMTVDTKPVMARLYSQAAIERKYLHYKYFPLEGDNKKKEFFVCNG